MEPDHYSYVARRSTHAEKKNCYKSGWVRESEEKS